MRPNVDGNVTNSERTRQPLRADIYKEALAIMSGPKRFHLYLYGRHFTILSDHKPLEGSFDSNAAIPSMGITNSERTRQPLRADIYKEALAIMSGPKRFHLYLYGRHFTILSDHKPLEGSFDSNAAIPSMAAMHF